MFNTPETLLSLAEVAIALAGFSAVVVVMKRTTSGKWTRGDADRFHGMAIHAVFAVLFCFLPTLINVLVQDPVGTMHVACAVLGVQIVGHCIGAMRLGSSGLVAKISLFVGVLFGLLQFTVFTDWGVQRELELYIVGVLWHILQAGILFVGLIWIAAERIED
ncbi:MAG: hypothetical protein GKR90_19705 [Pseudomonadales bacterium]|nr:hypothetical protein [Pseudomonadales bacterium]